MSYVSFRRFLTAIAGQGQRAASILVLGALTGLSLGAPAVAQSCPERDEERLSRQIENPDIGEVLVEAQDLFAVEQFREAISLLNEGFEERTISDYGRGLLFQLRGSARYSLEPSDVQGAISDFEQSIQVGAQLRSECLSILYNIGSLYLGEGDYGTAIRLLEQWISDGGEATIGVHRNLMGAYAESGDLSNALRHGELAYDKATERPRPRWIYDALDNLYTRLNRPSDRLRLLTEMVSVYPREKIIWQRLAQLYGQLYGNRDQGRRAFEIYQIMYLNGMLSTENEIVQLSQYYSQQEIPYRGALILQKEMNAGRVARSVRRLDQLGQYWKQAREYDRALGPLSEAAERAGGGRRYLSIAESLKQQVRLDEAQEYFERAFEEGGLEDPDYATSLYGNTVYERGCLMDALEIYDGLQESESRRFRDEAADWRRFILGELAVNENRRTFEERVRRETLEFACRRVDPIVAQSILDRGEDLSVLDPALAGVDCTALLDDPTAYFEVNPALSFGQSDGDETDETSNAEDEEPQVACTIDDETAYRELRASGSG